jgi:hypothetical protein
MSSNDGSFSFSPGSLGGEDETEGHGFRHLVDDEADTGAEGHSASYRGVKDDDEGTDAEGHAFSRGVMDQEPPDDDDDAEGHVGKGHP